MDLKDLRSSDPALEEAREEEVFPGVSLDELDRRSKTPPAKNKGRPAKEGELQGAGSSRSEALKEVQRKGDLLTARYRFDRKKINKTLAAFQFFLLILGLFFRESMFFYEAFKADPVTIRSAEELISLFQLRGIFSYFPLYILALFVVFPFKRHTGSMYEVYHGGMSAPLGIFLPGKPLRRRMKWRQIASFDLKSRRGVPYVLLLDKDQHVLGELRLDIDNPAGLYRAILLLAPKDHVLRKLVNN